jgi:molecular chaperone HtpG
MSDEKVKSPEMERGTISVSTEDIFPIIKKSLYSEHEIFLRELISNAVDATQKLKFLAARGEVEGDLGELNIVISLDKEAKTLTISDNGIGMNAEEVKKYINQVAFSGAEEFVKKFKEADGTGDIIGKFGLGFYSAFMVSQEVELVTRSYREGEEAVRWTCDGTTTYTLAPAEREQRGTDVILHITEEDEQYLEESRITQILNRYARFLPIPVLFKGEQVNNTEPLWRKPPAELKDEDYQSFYKELYPMGEDPLFWIHLNVDYPFNLTGILYFPKIKKDIDPRRNQIQLYSRQVFITDEVKDIVPEYLMLLQGVIDSPDIPLNVSRSYLQGDPNVKKISNYITKKVADKLTEIFKEDRSKFEEKWNDISVFVKYGMMTDDKFYEKAEKFCLVENVEGNHFLLSDYQEKIAPLQTDKDDKIVHLYTTDKAQQDVYIQGAHAKGYDVLNMDGILDSHFIGLVERKEDKTRWVRVDADTLNKLIPKEEEAPAEGEEQLSTEQSDKIKGLFEAVRPSEQMLIETGKLGVDQLPVIITRNEFMRRMREQAALGGGMAMFGEMPDTLNVVVNLDHPLVASLAEKEEGEGLAKQLLDLGLLSQNLLTGQELTEFIKRSVEMIGKA